LQFFDDLRIAAQAIDAVYKPLKMNFEILGNTVPHLHAHIVPRYYNDPAPGRPIDPTEQQIYLANPNTKPRQQIYTVLTNLHQGPY
jgi:diadenosine tetraphosphate (Ap4A) HIT family hydrolase